MINYKSARDNYLLIFVDR